MDLDVAELQEEQELKEDSESSELGVTFGYDAYEGDDEEGLSVESVEQDFSNLVTAAAVTPVEQELNDIKQGLISKKNSADLTLSPDGTVRADALGMDFNDFIKGTPYPIPGQTQTHVLIDYSSCGATPYTGTYQKITIPAGATSVTINKSNVWLDGGLLSKNASVAVKVLGPASTEQTKVNITEPYHAAGTKVIKVPSAAIFKVGDDVVVNFKPNTHWVQRLNMQSYWHSTWDMKFHSKIAAINGNSIVLTSPITTEMNLSDGAAYIAKYTNNRIRNIKITNVTAKTTSSSLGSVGISVVNAEDVIIEDCNFYGYDRGVKVDYTAKNVTVHGCISYEPKTPIAGGNRYAFDIEGEKCLIECCVTDKSRHAYVLNGRVQGPNTFMYCAAIRSVGGAPSGPHRLWGNGALFDNVFESDGINFENRRNSGSGHGWAAANCIAYNANGAMVTENPPTARNFAVGCFNDHGAIEGHFLNGDTNRPKETWISKGHPVKPQCLYLYQVQHAAVASLADVHEDTVNLEISEAEGNIVTTTKPDVESKSPRNRS